MDTSGIVTRMMIEHLNLKLEKVGSCLRYVRDIHFEYSERKTAYKLVVPDKYINEKTNVCTNYTQEFNNDVRHFFRQSGVKGVSMWNTVSTIMVYE